MHRISSIHIKNFRSCRNVTLPLESYTPLVGQNNTGKSTILQAIEWVLQPKALSITDFFNPQIPVEVITCIDGISEKILSLVPEEKHRKAIEPYCQNGRLWIRVIAEGTTTLKKIKEQVWDVENCSTEDLPNQWRPYPTGLAKAVSVLLPKPLVVQAMHDLGEDLGKVKTGTTIKDLLDEIMEPLLKTHTELNNSLDTIRQLLTSTGAKRSEHLQQFDIDATDALAPFFPGLALDLDLQVIDVKDFFKTGDLHVTDIDTGDRRRFDQMGTGTQRAIQIALIRYLAETRKRNENQHARRLLLIDEPELYLHPQGVKRLRQSLALLAKNGFQIIFSTHSPIMLSRENAPDTVIVGKTCEKGTTTQKPLRHAVEEALHNAESQSRTLFELGNLAEIYFANKVVICEGKTDLCLLPIAYEKLYGHSPDLDHIAFISVGGCGNIPKVLPVMDAMGISAFAIVDLDFGYTHARSGGILARNGEDLIRVKKVLNRLKIKHNFELHDNGLPKKNKATGSLAADAWAIFATDHEGKILAKKVQEDLKAHRIWAWSEGCIEQVTGQENKGEDAIIEQEQLLQDIHSSDLEREMPAFKACFDWIRSF